jgi:hypothetical protein
MHQSCFISSQNEEVVLLLLETQLALVMVILEYAAGFIMAQIGVKENTD